MRKKFRRVRSENAATIDQRLLAEIRDEVRALPLANQLRRADVEQAKALVTEIQDIHDRLNRIEQMQTLLLRVRGIDAEALSEDEWALLGDSGALLEA